MSPSIAKSLSIRSFRGVFELLKTMSEVTALKFPNKRESHLGCWGGVGSEAEARTHAKAILCAALTASGATLYVLKVVSREVKTKRT